MASPDDTVVCAPAACGQCGAGLAHAPVTGVQKLQEFDITPPPPPRVTEYQVQARACGRCGTVTAGQPPRGSLAGRLPGGDDNPNLSIYSASKAAVIGLTKSAGKELATTGVLVNAIAPAV